MAAFVPGDELLARWTPAHEYDPRHLKVRVIEQIPMPAEPKNPTAVYYRVETNMGVTMVLPETDLASPPAPAPAPLPAAAESPHGEP